MGATRAAIILAGACAAALAAAGAARASVFAVLDSRPDAVTVLDPAAIQTVGQTPVRRAWSISVKRVLTEGGPKQPGYVRTLNEYDCVARQVRWRTFQVYSRFGDLMMKQDNRDDDWNPAPDEGEGAAAMKTVCDGSVGGAVISANTVSQLVLSLMQAWDEQAPLPPAQIPDPPKGKAAKPKPKAHKGRT
jgi:hypothetical protein